MARSHAEFDSFIAGCSALRIVQLYYAFVNYKIIVSFPFNFKPVISIIEIHIVTSYYKKEKLLEEVEQCTRLQTMNSHHTSNIFNGDFARSSIIKPEDQTLIFTSFKAVPVWWFIWHFISCIIYMYIYFFFLNLCLSIYYWLF